MNDHDAIVSNIDRVLLTNRTFFGGEKDWCCKRTGDRCASYNEIAKLSDPLVKVFHEKLCQKITQDGGDYRVVLFGDMRGVHVRLGFLRRKSSTTEVLHMDLS